VPLEYLGESRSKIFSLEIGVNSSFGKIFAAEEVLD
jgi:hypothetical protein